MSTIEISKLVPSFVKAFASVERVERQLQRVTSALDQAEVCYAVIGGHAVAAWVATIDESRIRNTKDVDILLRREDLDAAGRAVMLANFEPTFVGSLPVFLEADDPRPSRGVHVLIANEKVHADEPRVAPDPANAVRSERGYPVVDLQTLVRMKLDAFRLHDQVHLEDLFGAGLITAELTTHLEPDQLERLRQVCDRWRPEPWDAPKFTF
ncbi:MAG: hypothetical protein AB7N71_10715 [Phycisphaerae bacterium]